MAIDSKEKRQAILSIGRVWNRNTFPIATPDLQWRMSVGNVYGGNALSPTGIVHEVDLVEALSVGAILAATSTFEAALLAAIAVDAQNQSQYVADAAILESIIVDATESVLADLGAQIAEGLSIGASSTATLITDAGLTVAITATFTATGATFEAEAVTPDGRTFSVGVNPRTFTVEAESRTFTPVRDRRTFTED